PTSPISPICLYKNHRLLCTPTHTRTPHRLIFSTPHPQTMRLFSLLAALVGTTLALTLPTTNAVETATPTNAPAAATDVVKAQAEPSLVDGDEVAQLTALPMWKMFKTRSLS
ncbi:hypothetical protein V2W45_722334, partial [Cenococcum geophilum]